MNGGRKNDPGNKTFPLSSPAGTGPYPPDPGLANADGACSCCCFALIGAVVVTYGGFMETSVCKCLPACRQRNSGGIILPFIALMAPHSAAAAARRGGTIIFRRPRIQVGKGQTLSW